MATHHDAELILKLYQLRTDPTMRLARTFASTFTPTTFDDLLKLQRDIGSVENGYWRQVLTYWEMAAALVLHDALDADLFLDCNNENVFLYARFEPFFEAWLKEFGQPFMKNTAKLIETHPAMQDRYTTMLATLEARRKREAAQ